ncbi:hypothetical protein I4U23_028040 [Adineta vaga]|nr:hypothetical protein I4U23_028040 [Adineta vaga]
MIESRIAQMISLSKKKYTIAIEGNIGSGKSTVLNYLSKSSLFDIVAEPIETWTNFKGNNLLAMLYNDPHRWGFTFQTNVQMSLLKLHSQPSKAPVKNLYKNKILQNVEYEILNDWFQVLTSNDSCHLDLIVYLRTSPETCLERIKTRNRPEEHSITLDYLYQLHDRHEEWLSSQTRTMKAPVLIVDAEQAEEDVYSETNAHLMNLVSC